MLNARQYALALAVWFAAVSPAGARVFTIPSPQPFSLPGGISGSLTPAPNVDGCGILGFCPRDFLAFRVTLDAGSAPLEEVQATVPDRLSVNGIGYTSSIVDRAPDGVGIVGVQDTGRWFWQNPPPLQGGERSTVLVAAYYDGDLPGSVGGAFVFIDTGDVMHPGPQNVLLIESRCGNGAVDGGGGFFPETCDDGNTVDDDCCSESCVAAGEGSACSDHDACTTGETCSGTTCGGSAPVTCGACEQCFAQGGCIATPRNPVECRSPFVAGRSKLVLRDKPGLTQDLVTHQWLKGSATPIGDFGSPLTTDGWDLCIFDGNGQLLVGAAAPPGGTCATRPCWKALGSRGYLYKDRDRTPSGMGKMLLRAGTDGFASVVAAGKGPNLGMPALGNLTFPLYVELLGQNDQCFFSYFEPQNATRNDTQMFRGKSTN